MTTTHQIHDELERAAVTDQLGPAGGPEEIVEERYVRGRNLGCTTIQGAICNEAIAPRETMLEICRRKEHLYCRGLIVLMGDRR